MEFFLAMTGIVAALLFSVTNGMHDIGNIVAVMISSGAMGAKKALTLVVIIESIGALLGGAMVAGAIASLVDTGFIIESLGSRSGLMLIVLSGIAASMVWNVITLHIGLPSSSTHALLGGLTGAAVAATGSVEAINWGIKGFQITQLEGFCGITAALLFSPILGFTSGYILVRLMKRVLLRAPRKIGSFFKKGQLACAAALAFGHGSNAAQKSMGLILLFLTSAGCTRGMTVSLRVKFFCAMALAFGSLSGGRKVMKTIGQGIFRLRPEHGFEAQMASAAILLANSLTGGPVSTTQIVTSTVMGIGTGERKNAVRWNKVREIFSAWVFTLPFSILTGALIMMALNTILERIR